MARHGITLLSPQHSRRLKAGGSQIGAQTWAQNKITITRGWGCSTGFNPLYHKEERSMVLDFLMVCCDTPGEIGNVVIQSSIEPTDYQTLRLKSASHSGDQQLPWVLIPTAQHSHRMSQQVSPAWERSRVQALNYRFFPGRRGGVCSGHLH